MELILFLLAFRLPEGKQEKIKLCVPNPVFFTQPLQVQVFLLDAELGVLFKLVDEPLTNFKLPSIT